MCMVEVVAPRLLGDRTLPPSMPSLIMIIESPIRILACMILPSGVVCLDCSFALNAFLYHSSASAVPVMNRYGVTVLNPAGIAGLDFFGLAFLAFLLLLLLLDFDGIT